jgi:hypothetical protein
MTSYSATTALPYEHLERATAGLRGTLRQLVLDDGAGELPDWSTLQVAGPVTTTGARGRTWYEYAATVESRHLRA